MITKKEEKKTMDSVLKDINASFGEGTAFRLGKMKPAKVEVFSTGSFSLDLALGVGGLPRGRIVEIYGPESSGKTSLALSVVSQVQKMGGEAVYVDVENALDLDYASRLGVDVGKMVLSQPQSAEEALNLVQKFVESGISSVVVIDSVAALVPNSENESEIGSSPMASQARLMSQAMRKMASGINKTNTLVIFINQIRANLAARGYGSPEVTSGGRALKYYASVRVDIRRIGKVKDGEEVVGNQVRAKVVKSKVAAPFKSADFCLMFADGISYEADILNVALKNKVVEKKGNTLLYGELKLGVGQKQAVAFLKANRTILESIKSKLDGASLVVDVEDPGDE